MGWIQLSWVELHWFELNWIELSWIELRWIELKSVDLYWVGLNRIELSWSELSWIWLSWMSWVDSRCQRMHIKKAFHCMHEASMIAHLACTKWSAENLLMLCFEKLWNTSFMWKLFRLKSTWQAMYFPPTQRWPCEEKCCWIAALTNYTQVRKQNENELLQKATVPPRTQHHHPKKSYYHTSAIRHTRTINIEAPPDTTLGVGICCCLQKTAASTLPIRKSMSPKTPWPIANALGSTMSSASSVAGLALAVGLFAGRWPVASTTETPSEWRWDRTFSQQGEVMGAFLVALTHVRCNCESLDSIPIASTEFNAVESSPI